MGRLRTQQIHIELFPMFKHSFTLAICVSMFIMKQQCEALLQYEPPPQYSQNDLPITSFSCKDKTMGVYYADYETQCQMFHVCVKTPGFGIQNFRFLCPNYTLFDQESQICDDWYNIDCDSSYHNDNFDLYKLGSENRIKVESRKNTQIPVTSTYVPLTAPPLNDRFKKFQEINDLDDEPLRGSDSGNFFSSKFETSKYNEINDVRKATANDTSARQNDDTRNILKYTKDGQPNDEKNKSRRKQSKSFSNSNNDNSYRTQQEHLIQKNDRVNEFTLYTTEQTTKHHAQQKNDRNINYQNNNKEFEFKNFKHSSDDKNLQEAQKYNYDFQAIKLTTPVAQREIKHNSNYYRNNNDQSFKQVTLPSTYSDVQYDSTLAPNDDASDERNYNDNPYVIKATINPYLIGSEQTTYNKRLLFNADKINSNDTYYPNENSKNVNNGQQRKILKTIKPINKNSEIFTTTISSNITLKTGLNVENKNSGDASFLLWSKYFPSSTTTTSTPIISTAQPLNYKNDYSNARDKSGQRSEEQTRTNLFEAAVTPKTNSTHKNSGHQKDEYDYAYYDDAPADYVLFEATAERDGNSDFSKTTVFNNKN